jgi:hypothetical protein
MIVYISQEYREIIIRCYRQENLDESEGRRGPLSLVSAIEELLGRKSSAPV